MSKILMNIYFNYHPLLFKKHVANKKKYFIQTKKDT